MHRDAESPNWERICIDFQCGGPAMQCIYSSPKRSEHNQTDRQKIIKGPQTTGQTDGWKY